MLSRRILLETTRYPAKIAFSSLKVLAAIESAKSLGLTHGFIQSLRQVGQVQVRRGLVAFSLEAGIEALLRILLVSQVRSQKDKQHVPEQIQLHSPGNRNHEYTFRSRGRRRILQTQTSEALVRSSKAESR